MFHLAWPFLEPLYTKLLCVVDPAMSCYGKICAESSSLTAADPTRSQNIHALHLLSTGARRCQYSGPLRFLPRRNDMLNGWRIHEQLPRLHINRCMSSRPPRYNRRPRVNPARLPCATTIFPPAHLLKRFITKRQKGYAIQEPLQ